MSAVHSQASVRMNRACVMGKVQYSLRRRLAGQGVFRRAAKDSAADVLSETRCSAKKVGIDVRGPRHHVCAVEIDRSGQENVETAVGEVPVLRQHEAVVIDAEDLARAPVG